MSVLVQACGVGASSDDHERPADAIVQVPNDALQEQDLEDPWGSGGRGVDAAQDVLAQGGVSGQGGAAGGAGGSPGAGSAPPADCDGVVPSLLHSRCRNCLNRKCADVCGVYKAQDGADEVMACQANCEDPDCYWSCFDSHSELFGLGASVWAGLLGCGASKCVNECKDYIKSFPPSRIDCNAYYKDTDCGSCHKNCSSCSICLEDDRCRNYADCRFLCGTHGACKDKCKEVYPVQDLWAAAFGQRGICAGECEGVCLQGCKNFVYEKDPLSDCSQCVYSKCGTQCDACVYNDDCYDLAICVSQCESNACVRKCIIKSSDASVILFRGWNECVGDRCHVECY